MEGDTVILRKKDREVSDTANWNLLLGQRLEVLELMDTCEDEYCFHTMKVKTTKGEILDVDVDENHDDMMDGSSVFREVYFR
tara:strand:- start:33 stop:278 length:246 start_codon:yes stop_codon:yes gene_type:complete